MWNIDLDISSSLICLILLFFYIRRSALPLHRNRLFLLMMILLQATALLDIIASLCLIYAQYTTKFVLYLTNVLYFIALIAQTTVFAFFSFSVVGIKICNKICRVLLLLPFIWIVLLTVFSPWTGMLFEVERDGTFYRGPLHFFLFICCTFYYLVGMGVVYYHRKNLRRLFQYPIYICGGLVIISQIIQYYFLPYFLVITIGQALGILVLFLTFQNPDFYKDSNTMLFTSESRRILWENDVLYGIKRRGAMIAFENYEELRNTYGHEVMRRVVVKIGVWMKINFPKSYCFYVNKGRFLLVSDPWNRNIQVPFSKIKEYFKKPIKVRNVEMYMMPYFAHIYELEKVYSYEELYVAWELAIKKAQIIGKGTVVEIDELVLRKAVRDAKINRALERAIAGDGLEVYYQPIYSTAEKKVTSAEALVRIRDEELGLIYPDEFIWKAEENNSILLLGQKIFEKVCSFIQEHNIRALGLSYLEVNLSPVQCMRQQLADEFEHTVQKFGIAPSTINLEITESGNNVSEIIQQNMERLSKFGMTFSLDDYGTGFSNLVNVLDMPLQIVKIDKSIVWAYFKKKSVMLTHVIRIFKDSHLKIVCEGVETQEMVDDLVEMGCDYLQGYYFSKPVPEAQFLQYLRRQMSNS